MSDDVQQGTLALGGAQLYYETRGHGPPVLLIQGGIGEAGASDQLATELARHYRVISYDRRGLSRSTPTEQQPITMATHAADAAQLLAAVTSEPAHVVGASIGALIGLHLAAAHPEQVATLVAHEPPMTAVHAEPEQEQALDTVVEMAREDVQAAIGHMAGLHGKPPQPEDGARASDPVGDLSANLRWFFAHDFPAVRAATLDGDALTAVAGQTTIVPTGGAEPPGRWEYRCAQQLSKQLDRDFVELPGGHNGLISHPWATARALQQLFTEVRHG